MSICSCCYSRFSGVGFNVGQWWNNDPDISKVCSSKCKKRLWVMVQNGTWMTERKLPINKENEEKKMKKMIDPPSGWKYGFPKVIPEDVVDTLKWLVENGYPQEEIDKFDDQFSCRHWEEEEEEFKVEIRQFGIRGEVVPIVPDEDEVKQVTQNWANSEAEIRRNGPVALTDKQFGKST